MNFVTTEQQGYHKPSGNLLDAATSALALYNLPQTMRLHMERQRLQNQGLGLSNQGQGINNQQEQGKLKQFNSNMNAPAGLSRAAEGLPRFVAPTPATLNGTLPTTLTPPPDDSPANGRSGPPAYGPKTPYSPGSIDNASGNMYANTNENSSNGGISNDMTVTGTSAQDHLDHASTGPMMSALHASQAGALAGGISNNAPAMANGTSARGNSQLPPTIPGSTQGGGPISSPFNSRPFSSKGLTFNSGETKDNAGSMPREDSQQQIATVKTPEDHAKLNPGDIYTDPSGVLRRKGVPSYA